VKEGTTPAGETLRAGDLKRVPGLVDGIEKVVLELV
jgi:hypothetical protein